MNWQHFFVDSLSTVIIFTLRFIVYTMISILFNCVIFKGLLHSPVIECILTPIIGLIIIQIALPSLLLLWEGRDLLAHALKFNILLARLGLSIDSTLFIGDGASSDNKPITLTSSPPTHSSLFTIFDLVCSCLDFLVTDSFLDHILSTPQKEIGP